MTSLARRSRLPRALALALFVVFGVLGLFSLPASAQSSPFGFAEWTPAAVESPRSPAPALRTEAPLRADDVVLAAATLVEIEAEDAEPERTAPVRSWPTTAGDRAWIGLVALPAHHQIAPPTPPPAHEERARSGFVVCATPARGPPLA